MAGLSLPQLAAQVAVLQRRVDDLMSAGAVPMTAYKISDQSRSSTTPSDDADLQLVLAEANTVYRLHAWLMHSGVVGGRFRWTWSQPSGATMRYSRLGGDNGWVGDGVFDNSSSTTGDTGSADKATILTGRVVTSSTTGTLIFQWSSGTADSVTLYAYSWISLQKIG